MNLLAFLIILVSAGLLFWLTRRLRSGKKVGLRPLGGYRVLGDQVGRAVESGRRIHYALGRGNLASSANPTSIAALAALDYLAEDACANDVPPLVTVGDGTLLPAAQDSLRGSYAAADRSRDYSPTMAQFLASDAHPMSYAAGASDAINRGDLGSNLMLGRFGSELGIITEAAEREGMVHVVGSDDPVALGVAAPVTDNLLLGEELFAAGAYLHGGPAQVASLQLQDVLRLLVVIGILLASLIYLVVG